ncbi:MAG: preprotein translocase subunit YajC [Magnetospirillum sp. WYHS-4]
MFVSPAFAQAASAAPQDAAGMPFFIMMLALIGVFYFLIIRPQTAQMKKHKDMLAAIRRGDRIVVGGIVGTVTKVIDDKHLTVEIAENIRVRVKREAVASVEAKTEPVKDEPANDSGEDDGPAGGEDKPAKPASAGAALKNLLGGKKS